MAAAREKEGGERGDGSRPVWKDHNLHVIWGVTLMAVLGSSSVSPAFPKVVAELGVSSGQVGSLIRVFVPSPVGEYGTSVQREQGKADFLATPNATGIVRTWYKPKVMRLCVWPLAIVHCTPAHKRQAEYGSLLAYPKLTADESGCQPAHAPEYLYLADSRVAENESGARRGFDAMNRQRRRLYTPR